MTKKKVDETNISSSIGKEITGKGVEGEGLNRELDTLNFELKKAKKDFDDFKKEQNIKLIEFLGVFTAILAFITISGKIIIDNLGLIQVLIFLPTFAVILMLFVLGIDSLVVRDNKKRFIILCVLLFILAIMTLGVSINYGLLI